MLDHLQVKLCLFLLVYELCALTNEVVGCRIMSHLVDVCDRFLKARSCLQHEDYFLCHADCAEKKLGTCKWGGGGMGENLIKVCKGMFSAILIFIE